MESLSLHPTRAQTQSLNETEGSQAFERESPDKETNLNNYTPQRGVG